MTHEEPHERVNWSVPCSAVRILKAVQDHAPKKGKRPVGLGDLVGVAVIKTYTNPIERQEDVVREANRRFQLEHQRLQEMRKEARK